MANAQNSSKKLKKAEIGDSKAVQLTGSNPIRAKASLIGLPPETIHEIFKPTNNITGTCPALTCKYLFSNAETFKIFGPPIKGNYS